MTNVKDGFRQQSIVALKGSVAKFENQKQVLTLNELQIS